MGPRWGWPVRRAVGSVWRVRGEGAVWGRWKQADPCVHQDDTRSVAAAVAVAVAVDQRVWCAQGVLRDGTAPQLACGTPAAVEHASLDRGAAV